MSYEVKHCGDVQGFMVQIVAAGLPKTLPLLDSLCPFLIMLVFAPLRVMQSCTNWPLLLMTDSYAMLFSPQVPPCGLTLQGWSWMQMILGLLVFVGLFCHPARIWYGVALHFSCSVLRSRHLRIVLKKGFLPKLFMSGRGPLVWCRLRTFLFFLDCMVFILVILTVFLLQLMGRNRPELRLCPWCFLSCPSPCRKESVLKIRRLFGQKLRPSFWPWILFSKWCFWNTYHVAAILWLFRIVKAPLSWCNVVLILVLCWPAGLLISWKIWNDCTFLLNFVGYLPMVSFQRIFVAICMLQRHNCVHGMTWQISPLRMLWNVDPIIVYDPLGMITVVRHSIGSAVLCVCPQRLLVNMRTSYLIWLCDFGFWEQKGNHWLHPTVH